MMPEAPAPPEPARIAEMQTWGRAQLPGDEARRESELLLGHVLQRDRAWLFAHASDVIDAETRARFSELIAQRRRGVPVAYLLGHWGFWNLELRVTAATLIPRPETEGLVEAALARLAPDRASRVADLGTGSGAIGLAIARERPLSTVIATDASDAALAVARENAQSHRIGNIAFRHGDWYAPVRGERFDLIASNPPYLAEDDPHADAGDLRFEPRGALTSGADGLEAIRTLAVGALTHLLPGAWLLLEHGFAQGEAVCAILRDAGLIEVETLRDLEQRERVTLGRAPD
jgi:release factor glutamine methyltransferase